MKRDIIRDHTFIVDILPKDAIVVDLGAHTGEFTSGFMKKYPFSKLVLVEANPDLLNVIQGNFMGVPEVEILNAVVFKDNNETSSFFVNSMMPEASSGLAELASEQWWYTAATHSADYEPTKEIKVQSVNIQTIMRMYDLPRIDLLKVDIEGGEWDLLLDLDEKTAKLIPQISVEFHDFYGKEFRVRSLETINHLKKLGYEFEHKPGFWGFGTPFADCIFYKNRSL